MPHDRNGNRIQKGDRVTMTGTVTEVYPDADDCNMTVRLDPAEGVYQPSLTCSTTLCEKAESDDTRSAA